MSDEQTNLGSQSKQAMPDPLAVELIGLLKQFLVKSAPYRTPLTTEERKEMLLIGDKSLPFIQKGKELSDTYPELVPPWCDKNEFNIDVANMNHAMTLKSLIDQVREAIYNIFYSAGDRAYHWVLDMYHFCKSAAERDVPNAKIVAEDLGKRFKNQGNKHPKSEDKDQK